MNRRLPLASFDIREPPFLVSQGRASAGRRVHLLVFGQVRNQPMPSKYQHRSDLGFATRIPGSGL